MPEIPELRQNTRMEYTSPVTIASVEQASRTGEDIQRLGGSVASFADTIAAVDKRKTEAKRAADGATAQQASTQKAIEIDDLVRRTGAPDGSDWVKRFNDEYDKWSSEFQKNYAVSDAYTQQVVNNHVLQVRNSYNSNLSNDARQESTADIALKARNLSNNAAAIVAQDPTKIDDQIINFDKTMETLQQNGFFDAKTALKRRQDGAQDIVLGAINGRLDSHRYDDAHAILKKYLPYFDPAKAGELSKSIELAQYQFSQRKFLEQDRIDKSNERTVKETQQNMASALAVLALKAKDPNAQADVMSQARMAAAKNQITSAQYGEIVRLTKDDSSPPNDDTARYLMVSRITSGRESLTEIAKDVRSSVGTTLSPKSGEHLLIMIAARQKKAESDPIYKRRLREADKLIEARVGGQENVLGIRILTKQQKEQEALLKIRMTDYLRKFNNPIDAAKKVLDEQYPNSVPNLVPGTTVDDRDSSSSLKAAKERKMQQWKNKQITDKEWIQFLKSYPAEYKRLENLEKAGGK